MISILTKSGRKKLAKFHEGVDGLIKQHDEKESNDGKAVEALGKFKKLIGTIKHDLENQELTATGAIAWYEKRNKECLFDLFQDMDALPPDNTLMYRGLLLAERAVNDVVLKKDVTKVIRASVSLICTLVPSAPVSFQAGLVQFHAMIIWALIYHWKETTPQVFVNSLNKKSAEELQKLLTPVRQNFLVEYSRWAKRWLDQYAALPYRTLYMDNDNNLTSVDIGKALLIHLARLELQVNRGLKKYQLSFPPQVAIKEYLEKNCHHLYPQVNAAGDAFERQLKFLKKSNGSEAVKKCANDLHNRFSLFASTHKSRVEEEQKLSSESERQAYLTALVELHQDAISDYFDTVNKCLRKKQKITGGGKLSFHLTSHFLLYFFEATRQSADLSLESQVKQLYP